MSKTIVCQSLEKATVSAWLLEAEIALKNSTALRVDFAKLINCDSAGLAALIVLKNLSLKACKDCEFINIPNWMLNFAKFYGVDSILLVSEVEKCE